jgi:hypothetical protein
MRKNATKREIRAGLEWLGLRELTQYVVFSERTLRAWIHSPDGAGVAIGCDSEREARKES